MTTMQLIKKPGDALTIRASVQHAGDVNPWEVYEAEKRMIIARNLPIDEQDAEIRELVRRLGL